VLKGTPRGAAFCAVMCTRSAALCVVLALATAGATGTRGSGSSDSDMLICGRNHNCSYAARSLPGMSVSAIQSMMPNMMCAACEFAAVHLAHTVIKTEVKLQAELGNAAVVTLLEEVCEQDIAQYGVQLNSSGMPAHSFTKDDTLPRAYGGWVKQHLLLVCGEIIAVHEGLFVASTHKYCASTQQKGKTG